MYTLTVSVGFEASHQLIGMPEGHKCAREHGHSYSTSVTLGATMLDSHGMVLDSGLIKEAIRTEYDHQHLNARMPENPTAENLARDIRGLIGMVLMKRALEGPAQPHVTVIGVTVRETDSTEVQFFPEKDE